MPRSLEVTQYPYWPARLDSAMASAYIGVSTTKFLDGVRARRYPQPDRDGGNVLWHRKDLDDYLASRRRGRPMIVQDDPYDAALRNE